MICWNEEAVQKYKEDIELWENEVGQIVRSVEEKWLRLKEKVNEAMIKKRIKTKRKEFEDKDWDKKCTRKKREVKRLYRTWRVAIVNRERYIEKRKRMSEMKEEKQRKLRNETEVWKFMNKRRVKKEWIENNIRREEWHTHFEDLLGRVEGEKEEFRGQEKENNAFDNVERETLWRILISKGMDKKMIGRLKNIYEETEVTEESLMDKFRTRKGVRQGCILSPLLFNVHIADIDSEMRKKRIGIKGRRSESLDYFACGLYCCSCEK